MIFNTGGVTQAMGYLYAMVVKRGMSKGECYLDLPDQVVSDEPWAKKIGMTEVIMMHELNKRAPDMMRKSIVVVDAIRDDAEQIVENLTGCFASTAGMPE